MKRCLKKILNKISFFENFFELKKMVNVSFWRYFKYKVLRQKNEIYWPLHKTSFAYGNIKIGKNSFPGATPGCYIQGKGKIEIGDNCIFGPNVGLISANHDIYNYDLHNKSFVKINNNCWIGMNSVILPGVELGENTIVAAGSVVTKSFHEGFCIIGGNPAKLIKYIDSKKVSIIEREKNFVGYERI